MPSLEVLVSREGQPSCKCWLLFFLSEAIPVLWTILVSCSNTMFYIWKDLHGGHTVLEWYQSTFWILFYILLTLSV